MNITVETSQNGTRLADVSVGTIFNVLGHVEYFMRIEPILEGNCILLLSGMQRYSRIKNLNLELMVEVHPNSELIIK